MLKFYQPLNSLPLIFFFFFLVSDANLPATCTFYQHVAGAHFGPWSLIKVLYAFCVQQRRGAYAHGAVCQGCTRAGPEGSQFCQSRETRLQRSRRRKAHGHGRPGQYFYSSNPNHHAHSTHSTKHLSHWIVWRLVDNVTADWHHGKQLKTW